eukprot:scaffold4129_cov82-Cyclotella_meneghiniana.AAC.7
MSGALFGMQLQQQYRPFGVPGTANATINRTGKQTINVWCGWAVARACWRVMLACTHHSRDALVQKLIIGHTTTPGLHEADNSYKCNNNRQAIQRTTTTY